MAMELGMTIPTQQVLEALLQEPERAQLRGALRGCMSCCIWAAESCFSLRSLRLALIDLPDFFAEWVSCGDLSAMAVLPRRGAGSALVLRSTRFSLMDLPDFFDMDWRGDLSAMTALPHREPEWLRAADST